MEEVNKTVWVHFFWKKISSSRQFYHYGSHGMGGVPIKTRLWLSRWVSVAPVLAFIASTEKKDFTVV